MKISSSYCHYKRLVKISSVYDLLLLYNILFLLLSVNYNKKTNIDFVKNRCSVNLPFFPSFLSGFLIELKENLKKNDLQKSSTKSNLLLETILYVKNPSSLLGRNRVNIHEIIIIIIKNIHRYNTNLFIYFVWQVFIFVGNWQPLFPFRMWKKKILGKIVFDYKSISFFSCT